MLKRAAKSIARALLGRYRLLRIYRTELGVVAAGRTAHHDLRHITGSEDMLRAADPTIREHAWFAEGNAYAFGLWENGKLACSCVVWDRRRFADAAVSDLAANEAALVDIVTAEASRQRGFALATTRYTMAQMERKGYRSLVCTVWHNNWPSIKAFEKAGWRYAAFVVEVFPLGRRVAFRFARHDRCARLERSMKPTSAQPRHRWGVIALLLALYLLMSLPYVIPLYVRIGGDSER